MKEHHHHHSETRQLSRKKERDGEAEQGKKAKQRTKERRCSHEMASTNTEEKHTKKTIIDPRTSTTPTEKKNINLYKSLVGEKGELRESVRHWERSS